MGLGNFFPPLRKVPLPLSLIIFLFAISKYDIREVLKYRQTKLLIAFFVFTCVSIVYALVTTYVFNTFKAQLGYIILFFSTYLIIRERRDLEKFIWAMILIHAVLVLINLEKLGSTMRIGSFNAGYFLGDGNDFSWSMCIFLPLGLYLLKSAKIKYLKLIAVFCSLLIVVGIIGTQSRGAGLALIASSAYFIFFSGKKLKSFLIVGVCLFVGLIFVSPFYLERMKTISSYDQDSSVQGRFAAWKAASMMALDHPLGVGAGNFNSAYGRHYRDQIDTSRFFASQRWISPHSIYFLVLGEYGFIGVLIILMLIYSNYRDNRKTYIFLKKKIINESSNWISLAVCMNMSLTAYSVGGIFLGGINYPHFLIITFLTIRLKKIAEDLP